MWMKRRLGWQIHSTEYVWTGQRRLGRRMHDGRRPVEGCVVLSPLCSCGKGFAIIWETTWKVADVGSVDVTAVASEMAIAVQIHPPNGLERPWLKRQWMRSRCRLWTKSVSEGGKSLTSHYSYFLYVSKISKYQVRAHRYKISPLLTVPSSLATTMNIPKNSSTSYSTYLTRQLCIICFQTHRDIFRIKRQWYLSYIIVKASVLYAVER
jgi:hypothetical protein